MNSTNYTSETATLPDSEHRGIIAARTTAAHSWLAGPRLASRGILIPAPCSADCVVVLLFAASLGRIFADMHLLSESCKRIYVREIYIISLTQPIPL